MNPTPQESYQRERRLAGLAASLFVLAACTAQRVPAPSGEAAILVVHGNGAITSACVSIDGDDFTGEDVLRRSEIEAAVEPTNPLGLLVCGLEGEGCDFPNEPCLCQCRALGSCSYWAYFNLDPEGRWVYAVEGARLRTVQDGDVDLWIWLDRSLPGDELPLPPPENAFESACG
ncbi:MAG TPA: hypothetical protein VLL77_04840 [Anaerolineales bacterium]|nr:hypothetical protein [Anaerolineales bacterium]